MTIDLKYLQFLFNTTIPPSEFLQKKVLNSLPRELLTNFLLKMFKNGVINDISSLGYGDHPSELFNKICNIMIKHNLFKDLFNNIDDIAVPEAVIWCLSIDDFIFLTSNNKLITESKVEIPVESKVEIPVESKVEIPVESKVEIPVESKVEIPVESKVEIPVESKVKIPVESKVEIPVESKVEIPVESKVEIPVDPKIEAKRVLDQITKVPYVSAALKYHPSNGNPFSEPPIISGNHKSVICPDCLIVCKQECTKNCSSWTCEICLSNYYIEGVNVIKGNNPICEQFFDKPPKIETIEIKTPPQERKLHFLRVEKDTPVESLCPKCHVKCTLQCDNDCGTWQCEKCNKEHHKEHSLVLYGHNPWCGALMYDLIQKNNTSGEPMIVKEHIIDTNDFIALLQDSFDNPILSEEITV